MVKYLVYVWGHIFLLARKANSLVLAPRVLLLEVMLTRKFCRYPEKTLLLNFLSHNGQMAHPENVLLALLSSRNSFEREKAVETTMKIRVQGPMDWNLDATSLQTLNLVPLSEARAEPPVTRGLSGLACIGAQPCETELTRKFCES